MGERLDSPGAPGRTQAAPLILYDGGCGLCHRFVRFVAARDPRAVHRFASLESATARALLARHALPLGLDSAVLCDERGLHVESTAALRILRRLRFPWPLAAVLLLVPRAWRDRAYRMVARRRLRWFGSADGCPLLDPRLRKRIVDE